MSVPPLPVAPPRTAGPSPGTPMGGRTPGTCPPGVGIPSVIGPVQRIREGAPVSRSEHVRFDGFGGREVLQIPFYNLY
jgi:hypothetical protein